MSNFLDSISKAARSLIAFTIVLMSFGFLFTLVCRKIPVENKDIIQISAGIVLGVLSTVAAYYFGSSKDKSDRDKADIAQNDPNKQN